MQSAIAPYWAATRPLETVLGGRLQDCQVKAAVQFDLLPSVGTVPVLFDDFAAPRKACTCMALHGVRKHKWFERAPNFIYLEKFLEIQSRHDRASPWANFNEALRRERPQGLADRHDGDTVVARQPLDLQLLPGLEFSRNDPETEVVADGTGPVAKLDETHLVPSLEIGGVQRTTRWAPAQRASRT